MQQKISVVINTYNAQKQLRKVLDAVRDFDEVLICDMESTDDTIAIATEYGCKIITYPRGKYNIVEPAREFAIHKAKYTWVLVVDADEIVTSEMKTYLYTLINGDDAPDGLLIPRKNFFMGRFMHCHYPDYILRFFNRDKTHWPPIIHASPEIDGRIDKIEPKQQELAFIHLAEETVSSRLQKTDIYTENELPKRQNKHYGTLSLVFRPLVFFFKMYILKGAFRDGKAGFIKSVLEAYYQFVMLAKLEEKKLNNVPE